MKTIEEEIETTLNSDKHIVSYWNHELNAFGDNSYTGEMRIRNNSFDMLYINYSSESEQVYRETVHTRSAGVYYLNEENDNFKLFNFFKFHGTPYTKKYNGRTYYGVKGVGYFIMIFEKCGDKKGIIFYFESLPEVKSWIDTAM